MTEETTVTVTAAAATLLLLVVGPPLVALLYTLSVWLTYSINHETPWTSRGTEMAVRASLLVASIAVALGLLSASSSSSAEQPTAAAAAATVTALVVSAMVFGSVSIWLIVQTRRHDVVGVAVPPFYGTDALRNKVVAITGANSGIGRETARQLAAMGASVVFLCRDRNRAEDAMDDVAGTPTTTTMMIGRDRLVFVPLDLGDFASVRDAVPALRRAVESLGGSGSGNDDDDDGRKTTKEETKKKQPRTIDVLVNNAGLMMGRQTLSKDGLELMMQANHLGHYLLTRLLLDEGLLRTGEEKDEHDGEGTLPPSRIVNLTSSTHWMASAGFDFDDMFCCCSKDGGVRTGTGTTKGRPFTLFGQYSMTKLANILTTKELARRYPLMPVLAVHPGIVRTNVTSNMQWYWRVPDSIFGVFVMAMQKTPTEGAYSTVFASAAPESDLPPTGSYVSNCRPCQPSASASSQDDALRLWQVSADLVGLPRG